MDSKTCLSTEIGAVLILFNVVFAPCRLCLKKMNQGYFVQGLYLPDISVFLLLIMSSLLWFSKKKKTRLFWSGKFFIQDCLIPSNRSITVCAGTFLFGFLWLGFFYAYWSISQKSVKGVVIQALLIMGGNSKNSDELREKSTRAILVTQAVNDLGYSILTSFR